MEALLLLRFFPGRELAVAAARVESGACNIPVLQAAFLTVAARCPFVCVSAPDYILSAPRDRAIFWSPWLRSLPWSPAQPWTGMSLGAVLFFPTTRPDSPPTPDSRDNGAVSRKTEDKGGARARVCICVSVHL